MRGCITTRHLLTQAATIISEFGWRTYARAVALAIRAHMTGRPCGFLDAIR